MLETSTVGADGAGGGRRTNLLVLSRNYEDYRSGYYHQDLVDALSRVGRAFVYGPGYPGWDPRHTLDDVLARAPFGASDVDLVVCTTSWDVDDSDRVVDPHPRIDLSSFRRCPKVYFLNKEYKKLDLRLDYVRRQGFDLVCTVLPDTGPFEAAAGGARVLHLPFGISLQRFRDLGLPRIWDFAFTGSLHRSHTDARRRVKEALFEPAFQDRKANHGPGALLRGNPLREPYRHHRIFWAEFGARDFLGRSLLPRGERYARFLARTRAFLNTPSAAGIMGTRFFELMATGSLILCPRSDRYLGILRDGHNCLMFDPSMTDFHERFSAAVGDEGLRRRVTAQAALDVAGHSYDARVATLMGALGLPTHAAAAV
ncbi:glycosyltransferase [Myxococcota bacterium]|nr:glycosyltransferase [Myxococcota bacterium]